MGSRVSRITILSAAGLAVAISGCQSTPRLLKPLTKADRSASNTPETAAAPLPAADAQAASPFTRATLAQHTFAADGLDFDPDVASAAGLLAFASTRHTEHSAIYVQALDSRDSVQVTPDTADHIQPRFSPDGQYIAFASNRGGDWDIWIMRHDGRDLTPLANDPAAELAPCWSPDGTQIAFSVWSLRSRTWEIWTCPVTRPAARRFIAQGMCPAWSPDGTRLAFQRAPRSGDPNFGIWTVETAGGGVTNIVEMENAACLAPRWSPDGALLLYCVVPTAVNAAGARVTTPLNAELWTIGVHTGTRAKLPANQGASFSPTWASDGRIFFVSGVTGAERIWSLTVAPAQLALRQADGDSGSIRTTRVMEID